VVIFGESGAGKSSIINMLAGEEVFDVDGGANGTTFEHQGCTIRFGDLDINVWDTPGLNQSEKGKVPPEKALQQLFNLLRDLGGVNLVVLVTRFRVTQNTINNYHLMRDVLCGGRVPMVVAITNREFKTDNEKWWREIKTIYSRNQMNFVAHAIGTANRRLDSDSTYAELRDGLRKAIQRYGAQKNAFLSPVVSEQESRYRFSGIFQ
jgi:predicted GTPase